MWRRDMPRKAPHALSVIHAQDAVKESAQQIQRAKSALTLFSRLFRCLRLIFFIILMPSLFTTPACRQFRFTL